MRLRLPPAARCAASRATAKAAARTFSSPRIAQPLPGTHPHLMAADELTPGIAVDEYIHRRELLAERLPPGSLAIFPSSPLAYMAHDVPFPHHQDTDLYYLCGLLEASSVLVCCKPSAASTAARWHLFVRPASPEEAMWDGPRAGVEGAQRHFVPEGAAHALNDAPRVLHEELHRTSDNVRHLFYSPSANTAIDKLLRPMLLAAAPERQLASQPASPFVQSLRVLSRGSNLLPFPSPAVSSHLSRRLWIPTGQVRKSPAERALMRRSADLCADSMNATIVASARAAAGGLTEAALAAQFEFEIRLAGAERLAYPCVVAGGVNAVTLHYMHNNAVLRPQDMLLMDAGASLHGYCSDLTRTWPLNRRFSAEQRRLYEAVLDVNERIISLCVADGATTLHTLHRQSLLWTYEHLIDLGIVRVGDRHGGSRCQRYFPHAIGHWLGLDVHDTPSIGSGTQLEANMVVTVEPGLYFPADDPELPEWCRGIGIRIEDDVLVAPAGELPEVLTARAPKRPDEIEALMSS